MVWVIDFTYKMKSLFAYLFLSLIIVACKPENRKDCFKSNGPIKTITRELGTFDVLVLNDYIEYEIIQSSQYKIEITAGENLMSNITSSINNYSLTIENRNQCNFVRGYKHHPSIKIFVPRIKGLYHQGLGNTIVSSAFNQDSIYVAAGNSGNLYLSGKYNYIKTYAHGNTNIHFDGEANNLQSYMKGTNFLYLEAAKIYDNIDITTVSIGDVFLKTEPTTNLHVFILRDGNIFYKGTPKAIYDNSYGDQKGKLIKND